jgi:Arc/MetJ-type ribon-helix-helix transcriptional regulator
MMAAKADAHTDALQLPGRTLAQLDTLVRDGHFANRQAAIVAAVERLYQEESHLLTARQAAFARLCCDPQKLYSRDMHHVVSHCLA